MVATVEGWFFFFDDDDDALDFDFFDVPLCVARLFEPAFRRKFDSDPFRRKFDSDASTTRLFWADAKDHAAKSSTATVDAFDR